MVVRYTVGWFQASILFRLHGSVFKDALLWAGPCAILSFVLKILEQADELGSFQEAVTPLANNAAFSGVSFLVGFIIVFRTGQSYSRFMDSLGSVHQMLGEWLDCACSIVAFARNSNCSTEELNSFLHTIVRLFSVLSASALQELTRDQGGLKQVTEEGQRRTIWLETIDRGGLDPETRSAMDDGKINTVILVYQWIQQLVLQKQHSHLSSVPPPVLARAFNELAAGMMKFHDTIILSHMPFPFPYAQTTVTLLIMHWILTPLVMVQWTNYPWAAGVFTFVQVFILWALNAIATGIERPFAGQPNDINPYSMQKNMNMQLLTLVNPKAGKLPILAPGVSLDYAELRSKWVKDRRRIDADYAESMRQDGLRARLRFLCRLIFGPCTRQKHSDLVEAQEPRCYDREGTNDGAHVLHLKEQRPSSRQGGFTTASSAPRTEASGRSLPGMLSDSSRKGRFTTASSAPRTEASGRSLPGMLSDEVRAQMSYGPGGDVQPVPSTVSDTGDTSWSDNEAASRSRTRLATQSSTNGVCPPVQDPGALASRVSPEHVCWNGEGRHVVPTGCSPQMTAADSMSSSIEPSPRRAGAGAGGAPREEDHSRPASRASQRGRPASRGGAQEAEAPQIVHEESTQLIGGAGQAAARASGQALSTGAAELSAELPPGTPPRLNLGASGGLAGSATSEASARTLGSGSADPQGSRGGEGWASEFAAAPQPVVARDTTTGSAAAAAPQPVLPHATTTGSAAAAPQPVLPRATTAALAQGCEVAATLAAAEADPEEAAFGAAHAEAAPWVPLLADAPDAPQFASASGEMPVVAEEVEPRPSISHSSYEEVPPDVAPEANLDPMADPEVDTEVPRLQEVRQVELERIDSYASEILGGTGGFLPF